MLTFPTLFNEFFVLFEFKVMMWGQTDQNTIHSIIFSVRNPLVGFVDGCHPQDTKRAENASVHEFC